MDVEAVGEDERFPRAEVRRDSVLIDLRLNGVGDEHHDQVAAPRGFGRLNDFELLLLRLGA